MKTEIKTFKNGLTLASTKMEGFSSVAFNIFVKMGSINETKGYFGISHFIEHMLFKGTKTRTAYDIAKQLDSLGANVNAYTDKEETTYFFKTTNENLEKCVEILADMFFNSTFDNKEMAREKNVVCEEIAMYNDDAYSKSELLCDSMIYNGNSFSYDVAGSKQSVKALTKQKILNYMNKFYTPQNTIISFSGNITMKQAEKLTEKYFLNHYDLTLKDEINEITPFKAPKKLKCVIDKQIAKSFKDNEQANICISYKAFDFYDDRKYALAILDNAIGKGMSSRLFQLIREKLGLVYNISSSFNLNEAGGDFGIHFATTTKNANFALKEIRKEIENLIKNGLTETEFLDAKNNYLTLLELSDENTSAQNLKVCKNLKNLGRVVDKQEIIDNFKKVSLNDVNKLFKTIFDTDKYCISYVGKNTKINLLKNYSLSN